MSEYLKATRTRCGLEVVGLEQHRKRGRITGIVLDTPYFNQGGVIACHATETSWTKEGKFDRDSDEHPYDLVLE